MNVFIISAPYQILSAVEAIKSFNLKSNNLIVLDVGLFKRKSFSRVLDKRYWDSFRFLNLFYRFTNYDFSQAKPSGICEKIIELYLTLDQAKKRFLIERLCKSISPVENLFLGNYLVDYDLHMRHIANKTKYKNLYLLDVGTDTLRINKQRIEENFVFYEDMESDNTIKENGYSKSFAIKNFKRKLYSRLIDWDKKGVNKLTYFTCYQLQISGKDQIVKNNYSYSKSLLNKNALDSQDVLFLGQPLVEQGYLSLDFFLKYMRTIKTYFKDHNLFYAPHPRESKSFVKLIQYDIGIRVKEFVGPIEHEIVFGGWQPKYIAAFFTSALESFSVIFGDKIELLSFFISEENLLKDKTNVKEIYENFKKNKSIKISKLTIEL